MKSFLKIIFIIFLSAGFIAIVQNCQKPTPPSVTTLSVSDITTISSVSGGNVTNNGGEDVISRGVCWQTDLNPTVSSNKTNDGTGNGTFISNMTGLTPNTTYYVRAYAINSVGTGYGNEISFSTSSIALATLTTTEISSITPTTALSGGNITDAGGGTITARGVCWNTSSNPTIANSLTNDGTGSGSFTSNLINLLPATTYYVKAYATNSGGTAYANNEVTFTTSCLAPSSPVVGTITQPTCAVATGSVALSGLPSNGTWTLTRTPGGTTTSGTGTSATISGLAAGTYTFTVTDASGCVSTASANVVINTPLASPSAPLAGTITQPTCAVATGSVTLSGLPASGTWTLTRTPGGTINSGTGTSTTISGLTAGTYIFTVTDASGCVSAASGNVVINTPPVTPSAPVVGTITQPTCAVLTGSVVLSGLPSTGTWTLTRAPGGTTYTGTGASRTVTGLPSGTTYTFTVTNSSGCVSAASGNVAIGVPTPPSAITNAATSITATTVTLNGSVNANGSSTIVTFEYGLTTGYGSTITATQSPVAGTSNTAVSATVTGLAANSIYYYRVKAVNCGGTTNGGQESFTTLRLPVYVSSAIEDATPAVLEITFNQTLAIIWPEISAFGVKVNSNIRTVSTYSFSGAKVKLNLVSPVSNGDIVTVSYTKPSTTPLQNESGEQVSSFSDRTVTNRVNTILDHDGNAYGAVTIGTQVWMATNLRTTKYNDGGLIPNSTSTWSNLTTGAYCWYNNDDANKATYGALYNWYAVNTSKLCPTNWHVPTMNEWLSLMSYLGGTGVAGGKLKELGLGHWNTPNTGATDDYDFTALPGGYRSSSGTFYSSRTSGVWWASGTWWNDAEYGTGFLLYNNSAGVSYGKTSMGNGCSVRCLKD